MLRFALVGCGRIARRHADLLGSGSIQGASLAAVCDIVAERAAAFGARHGVPHFTDFRTMMDRLAGEIDAVAILTPSGDHAAQCIALAEYGKPLVVEKPMALTLEDADQMISACDRNGTKLFVVKQNRYNYPVQKLHEAVVEGRFGRLVSGAIRVRWCRTQEYYDQDAWRGTWANDGGVFANQASHHIDLLTWMLGEPQSVYAATRTALVNIEAEDTGMAIIKFRNGALGVIEATTATRPKDMEGSMTVMGEFGIVEIGGFAVNEMKTWNFVESRPGDEEVIAKYRQNPPDVYGFGHRAYYEKAVESILYGKKALVDGLEGRKSLELILAMYESVETGTEVQLKFHPKKCRLGIKTTQTEERRL